MKSKLIFFISLLFILSCEDKVEKDTTPPELTIVSPTSGSTVGEIVQIKVQTTDESGILKVDFYIQNSIVLSDTTLPYEYEWNTTSILDGEYKVKVVSFDTEENFVENQFNVTVNNDSKKPTVTEIDSINYSYDKQSFEIYWTKNTDTDFKSYIIYESENEDMSSKTQLTELTDQSIIYYDTPINSGLARYYQIEVEDHYGLKSLSGIKKGGSWMTFSKTFGGSEKEWGYSVQQTTDGGYIVTGYTMSYGSGERDIWLIKFDFQGNEEWNKTFGGSGTEYGYSTQQTTDGGYIIVGKTNSYGNGNSDVYLVKTNSNGEKVWSQTFGGSSDDYGKSIEQTTDGGYIIAGTTNSFRNSDYSNFWLIKTNSEGDSLWTKTFGGSELNDQANSVQQTTDGGYIIAGMTYDNSGYSDFLLIKTNSQGNEEWNKTFAGRVESSGYSVQQTIDGGYVITGNTSSGNGSSDAYLIKTYSNGEEEWSKTFGGSGTEYGYSTQQTTDGGYIITGYTSSFGNGDDDVYLIKTYSNGDEEWSKTFGGISKDRGSSVQQTTDGGYTITGYTRSFGNGSQELWLLKTDPEGNIK